MRNFLVMLVVVTILTVVGARVLRHQGSTPAAVHGDVLRVRNLFTNIYGARVGDRAILFDAGVDEAGGALDILLGALHADRDAVSDVFLTHGHFDHVAAAPLCTKARIRVGAEDVKLLAQEVPAGRMAARWMAADFSVPPIKATDPYSGPATIAIGGGRSVKVFPLPGHTLGSYLLLFDGVLIAGDSLQIQGDSLGFAMGPFSDDMDANRRNIAALKTVLAGETIEVICTGHQACTPPGRARAMLDDLIARAAAS